MLLRDLVEVNEQGMLHSAINFKLMDDPETNLELCKSYIFNYDIKAPITSTLGVFDRVRHSFHSRNELNVHCTIMQYGKGKSHLALTTANFFGQPYDSPEVQAILSQIEKASIKQPVIAERIRSFKKNSPKPYLVLCLSGDWGGNNIRQHILDRLMKAYEKAGLDLAPLNLCAEPLRYLVEKVQKSPSQEDKANTFLEENGYNYTIQSLVTLLQENQTEIISIVKEIYKFLEEFSPNFTDEINVDVILTNTIESYCIGENARFHGLIIIFDELRYYLDLWRENPIKAGGMALQEITNVCENFQGRVALLSFSQIRLERPAGTSGTDQESFQKLSSRLSPQNATYEPQSSLELVLDNLLIQKENTELWQQFEHKWRNTFTAEARNLYEGSGQSYAYLGWSLEDVRCNLSIGCFPLHPYTSYLLANLSFTQDRSAIQFLHRTVVPFVQKQPAEIDQGEKPNYIYATVLVENFLKNYSSDVQKQYQSTLQLLSDSDNKDERLIIQALFLYWSSEGKLRKNRDQEDHEVILGHLTGLSPFKLSSALKRLTDDYKAIYYSSPTKVYRFYQGGRNPAELESEIDELIIGQSVSISDVINYVRSYHFDDKRILVTIPAQRFCEEKRQVQSDWKFKKEVSGSDSLYRTLSTPHLFQNAKHRGLVIYVFAETQEELQRLRHNVETRLEQSPVGDRIIVAIPNLEAGDLPHHLLKYNTLIDPQKFSLEKRQDYGESFTQLRTEWEKSIRTSIENIIKSCTFYCRKINNLNSQDQQNLDTIINYLLGKLYPSVPPIVDRLRSDHNTGKQIVQFVAKKLFANDLTDQNIASIGNSRSAYEDVINNVYRQSWGLLQYKGGKYHAQRPINPILLEAWDYMTNEAEKAKKANRALPLLSFWKTLSEPPYGYSEYNFVVLLSGWLSYHARTINLQGRLNLRGRNVKVETQRIKDWANSDILDKPQEFVGQWIDTHRAKIIFRDAVPIPQPLQFPSLWDIAQKYLEDVDLCLKAGDLEGAEEVKLRRERDKVKQACDEIEIWFQSIQEAEKLNIHTDIGRLIEIYPRLWDSPPPLDISGRKPSINPSQSQREQQKQVQAKIQGCLEQKLTADVVMLTTLSECDRRQQQIKHTQQILESLPEQSPEFLDKLEQTLEKIEKRRISLDNKPQSFGPIQAFLQQQAASQDIATPLIIQEQALEELAQLQSEIQIDPNPDLSNALKECGKKIQQKIDAEQEKLKILQNDLLQVNDRKGLDPCRQKYDRLAPIFQDSSCDAQYRSLEIIFDRLNTDLQKLDKIQKQVDKSQSIIQCEQHLNELEQIQNQLNYPEQFQSSFNKLKKQIETKINDWLKEIEQFQAQLPMLTNLAAVYQFQNKLLSTSDRYKDSAQENKFNALNAELRQWLEFFQILDNPPATLDEYQKKATEIDRWKQQQDQFSTALQEKVTDHQTELQQEIQTLNQARIQEALQWWQSLQKEASEIVTLEGNKRFRMSQKILESLKTGLDKHGRFIPERNADAQDLNRQCLKVLDEEKVDRIKQLFIQLPRPERHQLLQDLHQMITTETEVF